MKELKTLFPTGSAQYQKVARQARVGKYTGDTLLKAQLLDPNFLGHSINPELFAPTPAQKELFERYRSGDNLTIAVKRYLETTCPSLFEGQDDASNH